LTGKPGETPGRAKAPQSARGFSFVGVVFRLWPMQLAVLILLLMALFIVPSVMLIIYYYWGPKGPPKKK
jgi:hypothetical protein